MTSTLPSRFQAFVDLARLPWFGLSDEGRLVLKDARACDVVEP